MLASHLHALNFKAALIAVDAVNSDLELCTTDICHYLAVLATKVLLQWS